VAATTVDQTAEAIGPLADLPLVGGRIREAVARIRLGAAQANIDAKRTRSSIDGLARLLGLAVALAPTVPIAAGYAAYRVIEARRRRRARSAILPPSNGPPAPPERDAARAVPAHQAAVTG
jgi:hypothetical protein